MGAIKFILVILLCVPIAFLTICFFLNLCSNIQKQQKAAKESRSNKAIFQNDKMKEEEAAFFEMMNAKSKQRKSAIFNIGKNKKRMRSGLKRSKI